MDRYGHLFRSDDHDWVMDAIAEEVLQPGKPEPSRTGGGGKDRPAA